MMQSNLSETVRVRVRFSEVDSIKMVWHGNYVKYLEDAREAFGLKYDLSYLQIFENGLLAPVVDMKLRYYSVATVDDVLLVTATYRPQRGAKLTFDFEIRKESDHSLVLQAYTTQLFMNTAGEFLPSSPDFFENWKTRHGIK